MRLAVGPESLLREFEDACNWSTEITLCAAFADLGPAEGPLAQVFRGHLGKLRLAVVGLDRYQSDPALLRELYDRSVLRLVPDVEGRLHGNVYLFQRGDRVRVLMGSAPLDAARFAENLDVTTVFEGLASDPLACQAATLVERYRQVARLPRMADIDAYATARERARSAPADIVDASLVGPSESLPYGGEVVADAVVRALLDLLDDEAPRILCEAHNLGPSSTSVGQRVGVAQFFSGDVPGFLRGLRNIDLVNILRNGHGHLWFARLLRKRGSAQTREQWMAHVESYARQLAAEFAAESARGPDGDERAASGDTTGQDFGDDAPAADDAGLSREELAAIREMTAGLVASLGVQWSRPRKLTSLLRELGQSVPQRLSTARFQGLVSVLDLVGVEMQREDGTTVTEDDRSPGVDARVRLRLRGAPPQGSRRAGATARAGGRR